MLMGEYRHSLDDKGRVFVPAKLRQGLGDSFVVTKGLDHCLFMFPLGEWEALKRRLEQLPLTRSDARAFVRFIFAGASECELDRQGRILLPAPLREYAGIQREVVFIGVGSRAEIWSADRWQAYQGETESSYEEKAEKLADMGIL